jgi:hypothetical protein
VGQTVAKSEPKLTDKQRAFADAFVKAKIHQLDLRHEDIAKAAGYAGTPDSLRVIASRTLRIPHVRAYLREQAREHMADGGMDVAVALRELTAQRDDKRVRLDAARLLGASLGLTGGDEPTGPALVLNLVLGGNATPLVQAPGDAAQVIENARETRAARSLVQGERPRPPVRMVTAPPIASASAAGGVGGGGGDRGQGEEREGGDPSPLPPQTVGVVEGDASEISGVSEPAKVVRSARARGGGSSSKSAAKSVKGGAVAKSRTGKGKKARAKGNPRVKPHV